MHFACKSLACLAVLLLLSQVSNGHTVDKALHREREQDGGFASRGDKHLKDGQHDSEFDHESILGSSQDAEQFDHLPPDESKRRLAVLLAKMDANKDGNIDTREMHQWILRSFQMLSKEESEERFEEADENGDEAVTWEEHVAETYGDMGEVDGDTTRMMAEDKALFDAADRDGDRRLTEQEFLSFSHPEEDDSMVPLLIAQALQDKDKNGDGQLSFEEYIQGQQGEQHDEESLLSEKDRFDEDYDKNLDGALDETEIRGWLVPDNAETASSEVQHLFAAADTDENGLLSVEEILDQHELFVGSEVTDYGDHLHNMERFGDEL